MNNFTTVCQRVCLLVFAVGMAQVAFAQSGTPGNPSTPGGPAGQTPTAVPLDGGAGLLLAGGVAYGLRRLRQRRKQ